MREGLVECSQRRERSFEISLLTTLAAFNVAVGLKILPFAGKQEGTDTDPAAVNSHFEEATMLLNEAEKHNHLDISLLLRKGVLLLAQNKISQAEYQLKIVTAREPDNVAGHLALVCFCKLFAACLWCRDAQPFLGKTTPRPWKSSKRSSPGSHRALKMFALQ